MVISTWGTEYCTSCPGHLVPGCAGYILTNDPISCLDGRMSHFSRYILPLGVVIPSFWLWSALSCVGSKCCSRGFLQLSAHAHFYMGGAFLTDWALNMPFVPLACVPSTSYCTILSTVCMYILAVTKGILQDLHSKAWVLSPSLNAEGGNGKLHGRGCREVWGEWLLPKTDNLSLLCPCWAQTLKDGCLVFS